MVILDSSITHFIYNFLYFLDRPLLAACIHNNPLPGLEPRSIHRNWYKADGKTVCHHIPSKSGPVEGRILNGKPFKNGRVCPVFKWFFTKWRPKSFYHLKMVPFHNCPAAVSYFPVWMSVLTVLVVCVREPV